MTLRLLIFAFCLSITAAAESDRIGLDASVLADIPAKRRAALMQFAITDEDGTPATSDKKAKYAAALKALVQDLRAAYYWHHDFPNGWDETLQNRALYLAGLHYPASPTTGSSHHGGLIQSYTVRLYEEEVVAMAYALSQRFREQDVVIVRGEAQTFAAWKKSWDDAGDVKNGPNQPPM